MSRFSALAQRLPLGLLGTITLVVAIEAVLGHQGDELSHPWAVDWKHGDEVVRRDASRYQVLCFGDSLMKYGVSPTILGDRLGKSVYNLALGASPPPVTYYMLKHALARGARPEAILVDFVPHMLKDGPEVAEFLLPEVLSVPEAAELALEYHKPLLFGQLALARLLPSVKDRLEIRAAILGAFRVESRALKRESAVASRRNWDLNRGNLVSGRAVRTPGDDMAYAHYLYPKSWDCLPLNGVYVRKFFRLAAAHAIPVYWLMPPFSAEVHARRAAEGLDARYDRFIADTLAQFPTVTAIDGRTSGYEANVHADPLHLDRRGAAVFSEDVADVLNRHLAGGPALPRRESLPPFRDRPADARLEDMTQSHLAVRAGTAPATVTR